MVGSKDLFEENIKTKEVKKTLKVKGKFENSHGQEFGTSIYNTIYLTKKSTP